MTTFDIHKFQESIAALPDTSGYLVAYSGGMDSHVLLHAMSGIPLDPGVKIQVAHINHGLSNNAGQWQAHCLHICDVLGLELITIPVHVEQAGSIEARARETRYLALAGLLQPGHILLTAHHMDDQAETVLLQLFRGAGPDGLAGMPSVSTFARGWHARPLLGTRRSALHTYAVQHGLRWVDDDSNQDITISRNFLRQRILPELSTHWPGLIEVLNRAAANQADSSVLQDAIGELDLSAVQGGDHVSINLDQLSILSASRQRNVIRYWLKTQSLPVPGRTQLEQIITDMVNAAEDASPVFSSGEREIRRYRNRIYLIEPPGTGTAGLPVTWRLDKPLALDLGCLRAVRGTGKGLKAVLCRGDQVEVRYRRGGENIQLPGKDHHQTLKNLFQEAGVPPWYRQHVPLLFLEGNLAAVGGIWIDDQYVAGDDEDSWQISWDMQTLVFGKV